MGWVALAVATAVVSAGTVIVVRQAIGGGDLVNALSQRQVRSQFATAGGPTPSRLATAGSTPTIPSSASTTAPPRRTSTGGPSHAHGSSSSTTPVHHSDGSGSSTNGSGSTPSHSPTSAGSITRVLTSSGGSVVAQCSSASSSATVYLVSWSPAQGYQVDEVRRGPAPEASIDLEGQDDSVSVTYSCTTTGPVQQIQHDGGSHGSSGAGGSGGSDE
jgi:hypothetical protein